MTLQSLITRVEAGIGSDRALDADICVALQWIGHEDCSLRNIVIGDAERRHSLTYSYVDSPKLTYESQTPYVTSSLDAIRALMLARLKIDAYETHEYSSEPSIAAIIVYGEPNVFVEVEHPFVHRAFLSAVLKAIAAKEG